MQKTVELTAILSVIEHQEFVRNDMDTWAKVQRAILDTLDEHTGTLNGIAEAVSPKLADDGKDDLSELLRKVVTNGESHTEALNRLTAQMADLTTALTDGRVKEMAP